MSAGDDNIFARWSRRKQAVRDGATSTPDEEQNASEAAASADAEPVDQQPATEPDAGDPLPSLEDLTAESDLSAFLREGVPKALKSAALRKMWSLDPTIREYIGPSEYAWDFNQPGSMAGFGPLDANETIAEFLSTMSGGAQAGLARAVASAEPSPQPSPQQLTDSPPEEDASALPGRPAHGAAPAEPPAVAHASTGSEPLSPGETEVAAQPANSVTPLQIPRRHGGAMPR